MMYAEKTCRRQEKQPKELIRNECELREVKYEPLELYRLLSVQESYCVIVL
jgi:hypothetical protein